MLARVSAAAGDGEFKTGARAAETPSMRRTSLAIGALTLWGAACSDDATPAAHAAFDAFQAALFTRDAAAARALVTEASTPVVDEMPWDRLQQRQPLVVDAVVDRRGYFHVDVLDPNAGGARGTYVVVRENGRMVVDLIATAELHATPTDRPAAPDLLPRELTPADFEEVRRHTLATPPGEPLR
jgi:hypothetical protein